MACLQLSLQVPLYPNSFCASMIFQLVAPSPEDDVDHHQSVICYRQVYTAGIQRKLYLVSTTGKSLFCDSCSLFSAVLAFFTSIYSCSSFLQ